MADDDLPVPDETQTIAKNVPVVVEPSTSVIDTGPAPSLNIDPTSIPHYVKPLTTGSEDESPPDVVDISPDVMPTNDDVIATNDDVIIANDDVINTTDVEPQINPPEDTNSITSLEDLTLSENV